MQATTTNTDQWEAAETILNNYKVEPTSPITLLIQIQEEYNYLPAEVLEMAATELKIPLEQLYGLATFYKAFSLEARGRNKIKVCMGTACVVRGAQSILEGMLRELQLGSPGTTPDEMFTLEVVNCVGACALGPVAIVNGDYVGHLTQPLVKEKVAEIRKAEAEAAAQGTGEGAK